MAAFYKFSILIAILLLPITLHGEAFLDWQIIEKNAQQKNDPATQTKVKQWKEMLKKSRLLTESEKIENTNQFFNRILQFDSDQHIWKQHDFWATPLQALNKGKGDCEDFTIAKYISLRTLGISDDKLRLIYVRARMGAQDSGLSQAHMVLGYYPISNAQPLILDNLIGNILPASERQDLFPVFSFNAKGVWVGGKSHTQGNAHLSPWRDVLRRIQNEGFHQSSDHD